MNENAFVIDDAKSECPGESGGKHEYETRNGKELVCRRCNYVYSPALPANYEEALQSFKRSTHCSKALHGIHHFKISMSTGKADCTYCQLSYADWVAGSIPPGHGTEAKPTDRIAADALAAAMAVLPPPDGSKIEHHEGKKYLRTIRSAVDPNAVIRVDVYAVLVAFGITCPAQQHALKKCLAAGQRGKGTVLKDLQGAIDALHRAIELQQQREASNGTGT